MRQEILVVLTLDNYNSKEWSGMQEEKADCNGL
jgi:hypothetical protein